MMLFVMRVRVGPKLEYNREKNLHESAKNSAKNMAMGWKSRLYRILQSEARVYSLQSQTSVTSASSRSASTPH